MRTAEPCPVMPDRDIVQAFIDRGGAKHNAARMAMRQLLAGKADEFDQERLVEFVDEQANTYEITCAALVRLLDGGV